MGCDRLPEAFHGKEGVDGSSPSEGSAKVLQATFLFGSTCMIHSVRWVWGPFWSLQVEKRVSIPTDAAVRP